MSVDLTLYKSTVTQIYQVVPDEKQGAIARPPGGDIFGKMLLSKINVLKHARRIQGRGFDFGICRVDLAGGSP